MARPLHKITGMTKIRAEAVASAYLTNGFNGIEAVKSGGYTLNYARRRHHDIINHELVQQAIAKMQLIGANKTAYSIKECEEEYEKARMLAMSIKQPSAAVSAITGKARLYGFDKDATASREEPIEIPKELLDQLKKEAKAMTDPKNKEH